MQISGEEKKKLIKVHLNCILTKGSITFEDKNYGLEVYLDYIEFDMKMRRDDAVQINIKNEGAGVNLLSYTEDCALPKVTPIIEKFEDEYILKFNLF